MGRCPVAVLPRGRRWRGTPARRRRARSRCSACCLFNMGLTALARSLYLERMESTPWAVVDEHGRRIGTLEPMMLVSPPAGAAKLTALACTRCHSCPPGPHCAR